MARAAKKPAHSGISVDSAKVEKKNLLIEALSYIGRFQHRIVVVKYGGAAMVHEEIKASFSQDIVLLQSLGMRPVIVHGGGPEVSRAMNAMGHEPRFVEGLRVTSQEGLRITEMVLSGTINKEIIAQLNSHGGNGVGLSGKDGRLLTARKMKHVKGFDLGFVGEIVKVDPHILELLLDNGFIPVISPVAFGEDGHHAPGVTSIQEGKIAKEEWQPENSPTIHGSAGSAPEGRLTACRGAVYQAAYMG